MIAFTGMNIVITEKLLVIHGIPWLKERLKEYGLLNSDGSVRKEMTVNTPWLKEEYDPQSPLLVEEETTLAQNMKGCGVWAAYKFRPDIKPAILASCRHMQNPTRQSSKWIWHTWRYLAGSLAWVIGARKNAKFLMDARVEVKTRSVECEEFETLWDLADAKVFTDSNWKIPRSISGMVFFAFGLLINARAVLQKTTASSTTEAEIDGQLEGTKEAVWGRYFLMELFGVTEEHLAQHGKFLTIPLFGDNVAALKYARELNVSSKLKHVAAAYHVMYDKSKAKQVSFHQIASLLNQADYFTKPHGAASVDRNRAQWMILWRPE